MDQAEAIDYLKVRLGLVGVIAVLTAIGVVGLIKLINTASLGAMPLYIHVLIGAMVLPLVAFFLEYRGMEQNEALGWGLGSSMISVFFVILVSEGAARMINGAVDIGVDTFFYSLAIGVVAGTFVVMWVQRIAIDGLEHSIKGTRSDRST